MSSKFVSKRPEFERKNRAFVDMVKGRMAMDIETALKTTAGMPVKHGDMKSQTRHFRSGTGFRVEIDVNYAEYQERGARRDGSHRVRHYSTAGTSAGFFKRAISSVLKNKKQYIKEAAKAVGL